MANKNFVVKNGLTVGNLAIDADSGNLTTSGNLITSGVYSNSFFYANGTPYSSAGNTGYTGSAGTTGYAGSLGYTGSAGIGYTGSSGAYAAMGYTGSAATASKVLFSWNSLVDGNAVVNGGTLLGNAVYDSAANGVKLVSATNNQSGAVYWSSPTIDWAGNLVIEASVGASGGGGADGSWLFFGSSISSPVGASTNGFRIYTDFFNKRFYIQTQTAASTINFSPATYLPGGVNVYNASSLYFYNIEVRLYTYNTKRKADIYLNDSFQASFDLTDWTAPGNLFGLTAQTGGANANIYARQLMVVQDGAVVGSTGYTGSTGSVGYTGSASTEIGYTGSKGDTGSTSEATSVTLSPAFKGALVSTNTTQSIPAATWTTITILNTTVYDTNNFLSTANRFTIPAGVSRVKLKAAFGGASQTDQWIVKIIKNGVDTYASITDTDTSGADLSVSLTPVLSVVQGDYFELQVFSQLARSTLSSGPTPWFAIEVVEGSILDTTSIIRTTGYTGSAGTQGSLGYTGSRGIDGTIGVDGYTGSRGDAGYTGSSGLASTWIKKTANYTATSGERIIADTTSGIFTITLPATPSLGNSVTVTDGGNFTNNLLLVSRNGSTIEGVADDVELDIGAVTVEFFYDGATWQVISNYGPTGYTGSAGTSGYTGSTGAGYNGSAGYTGSAGIDGYTGSIGSLGYTGSIGSLGYTGSKGDTGLGFTIAKTYASVAALTADTSPTGIVAGQFAIIDTGNVNDAENSRLYIWNGSAYQYVNDLSGAIGLTGPQGTTGYTGSIGSQGTTGYTGSAGSAGTAGYTGSVGSQGTAGYTGSAGSAGTAGYTGSRGSDGVIGYNGSTGYTGSIGYTGSAGLADWTKITGNYTAVDRQRIMLDSSSGQFTLTLPLSPSQGTYIQLTDAASLSANPVTVNRNGSTIEGLSGNLILDVSNATFEFIYDGATWQVTSTAGPKGDVGYTGSSGNLGYTGSVGAGYTGSSGAIGYTGSRGTDGVIGYNGSDGYTGSVGYTGSAGDVGYTGSLGYTGSAGAGYTGSASTVVGYTGSFGPQGIPGIATSSLVVDNFTGNGSQTAFTLSVTPTGINQTIVNIDGVSQIRNTYSLSDNVLTFTEAPANGAEVEVTVFVYGTSSFVNRSYTGNGSATTFTVTSGVTDNSILVTNNGVVQRPIVDYSVSNTTITFVTAPSNNANIQIREIPAGSIGYTGSAGYIGYTGSAGPGTTIEILSPFLLMGA